MSRAMTLTSVVATLLLVAACGGGTVTSASPTAVDSQAPPSEASAAAGPCAPSDAGGAVSVKIANFAFDPATVAAKIGDVISWTNSDTVQHTATVTGNGTCTTPALATDASGGITFSEAGSYDVFCKIHPQMTGKIEVTS